MTLRPRSCFSAARWSHGLGDQRGGVEAGDPAQPGHEGGVEAAGADRGVGQVDDGVPGGVELGERGAQRDGLARADLPGDDPERGLGDAPADPGDGLGVPAVAVQHRRGEVAAERGGGEPEVGAEFVQAHRVLLAVGGGAVGGGAVGGGAVGGGAVGGGAVGEGEQVGAVGQPVTVWGWVPGAGVRGLPVERLRGVGQLRVVQPLAHRAGVSVFDQAQVVDPGRGRCGGGVGGGFGVDVATDLVRHRLPGGSAVVVHGDVGQVERVEHQLHPGPGQRRVDLVEVAVQGDGGGLGHGAPLTPAERLGQQPGRGRCGRPGGQEPGQRRHPGLRMHPRVVDLRDPGGEQRVQLGQAAHRGAGPGGAVGDLDQELVAHRLGRVGRAARCQPELVLFRSASPEPDVTRFRSSGSPVTTA